MQGVVRWWWGWSVFVALTFRNPPQLLPADAAQLPIRGHSHSTKPEMSRSIKCSPTCCLPNDTKKSLLVCYLQPNWLKATDLSHHWVLCETAQQHYKGRTASVKWSIDAARSGIWGTVCLSSLLILLPCCLPRFPRWPLNQICPRLRSMMKTSKDL